MGLKARDSCNVRDHNWGDLPLSTAISAVKGQKPEIMKRKEAGEVGFGSEMPFVHPETQELFWIWRLQNPSQVWGGRWWCGGLFAPWAADGGGSCVSAGFPCPTSGLPERFWDPNLECLTTKPPAACPWGTACCWVQNWGGCSGWMEKCKGIRGSWSIQAGKGEGMVGICVLESGIFWMANDEVMVP